MEVEFALHPAIGLVLQGGGVEKFLWSCTARRKCGEVPVVLYCKEEVWRGSCGFILRGGGVEKFSQALGLFL